jgi:UDP-galactopyranose mutase
MTWLIVGAGLSGSVLAERIANINNEKVLVIDKRDHIGGNCYDYIDNETKILMNKYGAHLFHTNSKDVWDYINKFDKWIRWEHKVLAYVDNKYVSIPVNITTVNELCNENIKDEIEFQEWFSKNKIEYQTIENSEQMCKSRVGDKLYEKLFKHYTFKQWNKYPNELHYSVLERIPIHNNFDTRYFNDKYQALPEKGYTNFFNNLLNHDNISIKLNTDFNEFRKQNDLNLFKGIIYTGPIDHYFNNGSNNSDRLEYRSIDFKIQRYYNMNFYQPNSVVNYPDNDVDFTRIVEYKHFLNQKSPHTIIVSETTNDIGEPFYPILNKRNLDLYEKYKIMAENEEKNKMFFFVGRLANYKYFNMDQAISNALELFNNRICRH